MRANRGARKTNSNTDTHAHTDTKLRTFKSAPQGLGYCSWPPISNVNCMSAAWLSLPTSQSQPSAAEQHSQSSHKMCALCATRLSFNIFKATAKMLKHTAHTHTHTHTYPESERVMQTHSNTRVQTHTHTQLQGDRQAGKQVQRAMKAL